MGIRSARRHGLCLLVGARRRKRTRQLRWLRRTWRRVQDDAGRFVPTERIGLYDTAGNAAEWVEDCWNDSYRGAPKEGGAWTAGQCGLRVLRGGSFGSKPALIRSAARFRYDQDVRYFANGFRAARDL